MTRASVLFTFGLTALLQALDNSLRNVAKINCFIDTMAEALDLNEEEDMLPVLEVRVLDATKRTVTESGG